MEQGNSQDWDPRYDRGFWVKVALTAGVPPSLVLGAVFAPVATVGAVGVLVVFLAGKTVLFKSEDRVAQERAHIWARAELRRAILRARMQNPDEQVTMWMRVVRAYYELTAPNNPPLGR